MNTGNRKLTSTATIRAKCCGEMGSPLHRNVTVNDISCSHCDWLLILALVEYKPILREVEKILEEAGLDEEEIRKSAAAGPASTSGQSRNRR